MIAAHCTPGGYAMCLEGLLVLCDMELTLCLLWEGEKPSP